MAVLIIDSLTVKCAIDGGIQSRIDDLSDRERAISGNLLITQLSSTANSQKDSLSCRTVPISTSDKNTLVTKLRSAATLSITGDIGARTAAPVLTGTTPIRVGAGLRWIVSFDLIQF